MSAFVPTSVSVPDLNSSPPEITSNPAKVAVEPPAIVPEAGPVSVNVSPSMSPTIVSRPLPPMKLPIPTKPLSRLVASLFRKSIVTLPCWPAKESVSDASPSTRMMPVNATVLVPLVNVPALRLVIANVLAVPVPSTRIASWELRFSKLAKTVPETFPDAGPVSVIIPPKMPVRVSLPLVPINDSMDEKPPERSVADPASRFTETLPLRPA